MLNFRLFRTDGSMFLATMVLFLIAMPVSQGDEEFPSIFDGKTLDGWHCLPADRMSDWIANDGILIGESQGQESYLVWKEDKLEDFELRFDYRLRGEGSAGDHRATTP
jgi:hypothetical protein